MAKQIEFTGKKLSKKVMDEKILRYLELNEQSKIIKKEIDILKKELEGQYTLPADQKEEFFGKETQMEKIPVDNGKNVYDIELLKPILKSVRKLSSVIKKVEIIDVTELNKLVKDGVITQSQLNVCRKSNWTFKTIFKRIENKEAIAKKKSNQKGNRFGSPLMLVIFLFFFRFRLSKVVHLFLCHRSSGSANFFAYIVTALLSILIGFYYEEKLALLFGFSRHLLVLQFVFEVIALIDKS